MSRLSVSVRLLVVAAALGVTAGAGSACLLELDRQLACGDGFVDALAGEECDPEVPSSFEDACRETSRPDGIAICDLDLSNCDPCGDGVVNDGEECDPDAFDEPGFVQQQLCAGTPTQEPLPNLVGKPYASGATSICDPDTCRWDRTSCRFCGDGVRDVGEPIAPGQFAPEEWCDGGIFDKDILEERFGDVCNGPGERVNVGCQLQGEQACREFIDRTAQDGCCLEKGAPCPTKGELPKCCFAYDNPELDHSDTCQVFTSGDRFGLVCR